jgi:hypothetical protein
MKFLAGIGQTENKLNTDCAKMLVTNCPLKNFNINYIVYKDLNFALVILRGKTVDAGSATTLSYCLTDKPFTPLTAPRTSTGKYATEVK